MKNKMFVIAGQNIQPGTTMSIALSCANLYTQTEIGLPAFVFHGKKAGPKVFVTATIHGDELNGIEIIRRLHHHKMLNRIHGTLITVPVANAFGLITQSRYLPDRRDLNRSFPGGQTGSLAARIANVLIEQIISQCQYGIDLHTGAIGRVNMPQLRVNLETPGTEDLANAFDVPVILDAKLRDGSLRQAASQLGIPLLVYEGGEALRLNELSIRMGVRGIIRVLSLLGMIPMHIIKRSKRYQPIITQTSRWIRAVTSGIIQPLTEVAKTVKKDDKLAYIHDPFLMNKSEIVTAPFDGIVVGKTNLPLVNEGDALFNIASIKKLENMEAYIEELADEVDHHW